MNLKLVRTDFTLKSTIGGLFIDGIHECFVLEDVCREASPGAWTPSLKIPKQTAIPYGRYSVVLTYSDRFGRVLPLLVNVPDFTGIRIHPGNTAADTEGCLLTGVIHGKDEVTNSRLAFGNLFRKLEAANQREKIWIEVTKPL